SATPPSGRRAESGEPGLRDQSERWSMRSSRGRDASADSYTGVESITDQSPSLTPFHLANTQP
ncbi:unnamed protein product, partial [Amoebophrya sp. A25]